MLLLCFLLESLVCIGGDPLRFHVSLYYKFPLTCLCRPLLTRRRRLLRISQSIGKQTNSRHQTSGGRGGKQKGKRVGKRLKERKKERKKQKFTINRIKWTQSVRRQTNYCAHRIGQARKKKYLNRGVIYKIIVLVSLVVRGFLLFFNLTSSRVVGGW